MSPAITKRKRDKSKKADKAGKSNWNLAEAASGAFEFKALFTCALAGVVLGLAAPGVLPNQPIVSALAWIALAPLLLAVADSKTLLAATVRGLTFGLAYNLVYLQWYLGLQPLQWLGFNWWQGWLLAGAAWIIVSSIQAAIIAIYSAASYLIPQTAGFLPRKNSGKWKLPAFLVLPALWVILINKVLNAPSLLGVPWSMLEYTQYQNVQLIQCASIIGGIGIGFLIVLANAAFANLYATMSKKSRFKTLSSPTRREAMWNSAITFGILLVLVIAGTWASGKANVRTTTKISVLQGNINIDMQKTKKRYSPDDLLLHYKKLLQGVDASLVVWSEGAMPVYLRETPAMETALSSMASRKGIDMIVGAMDRTSAEKPYNSAYGVNKNGRVSSTVYHKRYLVPFGEYAPVFVDYLPSWVRKLTNTPAGGGFAAGRSPATIQLDSGKVAPLICFECISPELAVASTRDGGNLLVNVSDLAWFHTAPIGEQMIAFSVFRAIENRRFLVFAANSGPSAVINPRGKILCRSGLDRCLTLNGRVGFSRQKSIFSQWFR